MKIVFATGNIGKLREASEILGEGFELVSLEQVGITEDIPETGKTLVANSLQKAMYLYDKLGCNCFADDTGLEVDALGGAPGVYTARYAGDDKDFNKNMDKVLYELQVLEGSRHMAAEMGLKTKPVSRRARFKSVVTLIIDGKIQMFEGTIISKKHGGIQETFTVRRLSFGVGVERTFPMHSPKIDKVVVVRKGSVRRAKLYYLKGKTAKNSRIKEAK